ncbi:MAG: 5'/3'-nucleotidase SurE [Eubacterium sp.]|nr:5'/3'-nucleotidase SurE [Eubacterium sp.]
MKILITNDDGIDAYGLKVLAEAASHFGQVTVLAPRYQSSAMSHHATFDRDMNIQKVVFPADGVEAWTMDGTPADCIRASFLGIMQEKPDYVFSGINAGANVGFDVLYSATVGAGMEALLYGTPAICFSQLMRGCEEVREKYLLSVMEEVMGMDFDGHSLINVNFPSCPLAEYKGILYDRKLSQQALYDDSYRIETGDDGKQKVVMTPVLRSEAEEGTDMRAIFDGYISIGRIGNMALS